MRVLKTNFVESLKRSVVCNFIYEVVGSIRFDFQERRFVSVFFVSLGNLFPDFIVFSKLRALLWVVAGAHIDKVSPCTIRKGAYIEYAQNLFTGTHFHVGRDTYFCAHAPIICGDHVTFSLNCMVLTMHHSGEQHQNEHYSGVEIGEGSIVYAGSIILPGTVLLPKTLIRAGSVYPKQKDGNPVSNN